MTPPAPAFLCVGAAHWDVVGRTAAALPPGADVPGRVTRQPGGVAQNVARALAGLGRPVRLLAAIGRDADGDALAADLAAAGVDCAWLCRHPGPTDRYLAIEGADGALHAARRRLRRPRDRRHRPPRAAAHRAPRPAASSSTATCRPRCSPRRSTPAPAPPSCRRARASSPPSRPLIFARRLTLYLNRAEAEALCGRGFADSRSAARAVRARGAGEVLVTDGDRPATATDGADLVTLAPPLVAARSVTGAGDAFVAAHLAARADGLAPEAALATALDAASRHITVALP